MNTINDFITEIIEKRKFLTDLLKATNDGNTILKISSSLFTYLKMERHLAQLGIFIDKDSQSIVEERAYIEKTIPYLKMTGQSYTYLFQSPDLDYVKHLLDILSFAYCFDIPFLDTNNQEMIELTKKFYSQTFQGLILQQAMELLNYSHILFLEKNSNDFPIPVAGRSYSDNYYQYAYSFIQKQYNIRDYTTLAHEIFHGLHFILNPNSMFSVLETKEIGANMIEYLCYDFFWENSISSGNILKKMDMMSVSNQSTILKRKLNTNVEDINIVSELLLIEAKLIGYDMAKEYMMNKDLAEEKLQQYIFYNFSMNSLPDYSLLGYSKGKILEVASQFTQERDYCLNNYQKSL